MKVPKELKLYCKKCNSHSQHKLKQFKAGKARVQSRGQRKMISKHKKGYGGKAKFTKMVKKQSKTPTFVAECQKCKTKRYLSLGKRLKKFELA